MQSSSPGTVIYFHAKFPPTYIFIPEFPVEVYEGERECDVERCQLVGVRAALARLKGDHQIDETSRSLSAKFLETVATKNCHQKRLESRIHSCVK